MQAWPSTASALAESLKAFVLRTSTCWWSSSLDPGAWVGLHVKTALYARSLRLTGLAGKLNPESINVQFYAQGAFRAPFGASRGLWYMLQSFAYSEHCVQLTSDFSTIFGNEFDTVAPEIRGTVPLLSGSPAVSVTQRLALYFSEPVVVMASRHLSLVDAGADALCGTADDVRLLIPTDLPTQYVRNGTDPWVYVTGSMILVRYPFQELQAGNYHCLEVDPGVIQDLAGTPFPGLNPGVFRFLVANTPFADATAPEFLATDPPTGSVLEGLQLMTFKIFMSHWLKLSFDAFWVEIKANSRRNQGETGFRQVASLAQVRRSCLATPPCWCRPLRRPERMRSTWCRSSRTAQRMSQESKSLF